MFHSSLEIHSDLENLSEIEDFIQSLMQDCQIDQQYGGLLCTPLMEAVKNAIIHGNHQDPHKMVKIDCQMDDNSWTFAVTDEGNGFSFDKYLKQKLLGLSHGLSIIFTLCENVVFKNNGSTILFCVQLPKQKQEIPQREWAQKVIDVYLPQLV